MAIRIHHTQQKQADKFGIQLGKDDVSVVASKGEHFASAPSAGLAIAALLKKMGTTTADTMNTLRAKPKAAKKPRKTKKAIRVKGGDEESEGLDFDEEDDSDAGNSIVKSKYRAIYKPNKMTCGDELAQKIRAKFMTVRDPDTKKLKLDWPAFIEFARANDCWVEAYRRLNKGRRRMNVVNRLRARIRNDHKVVWTK